MSIQEKRYNSNRQETKECKIAMERLQLKSRETKEYKITRFSFPVSQPYFPFFKKLLDMQFHSNSGVLPRYLIA